jgi:hypothetical protein
MVAEARYGHTPATFRPSSSGVYQPRNGSIKSEFARLDVVGPRPGCCADGAVGGALAAP